MEQDDRKKKLAAGKEKLAAFRKKRAKKKTVESEEKRSQNADSSSNRTNGMEDESQSSLAALSDFNSVATESDTYSLTSGDEWSAEESDMQAAVHYQTKLAAATQRIAELEEAVEGKQIALDRMVLESHMLQSSPKTCESVSPEGEMANNLKGSLPELQDALMQRDKIIRQLTARLQETVNVKASDDCQDNLHETERLSQQVVQLQQQLIQAGETVQQQVSVCQISVQALQEAKAQILALQTRVAEKNQLLQHVSLTLNSKSAEVQTLRDRERELEQLVKALQKTSSEGSGEAIAASAGRVACLERELNGLRSEHARLSQAVTGFQQQLALSEAAHLSLVKEKEEALEKVIALEQELEQLGEDRKAVLKKMSDLEQQVLEDSTLLTLRETLSEKQLQEASEKIAQLEREILELKEEKSPELEQSLSSSGDLSDLKNVINSQQSELACLQQELSSSSGEVDAMQEQIAKTQSEHDAEREQTDKALHDLQLQVDALTKENGLYEHKLLQAQEQVLLFRDSLQSQDLSDPSCAGSEGGDGDTSVSPDDFNHVMDLSGQIKLLHKAYTQILNHNVEVLESNRRLYLEVQAASQAVSQREGTCKEQDSAFQNMTSELSQLQSEVDSLKILVQQKDVAAEDLKVQLQTVTKEKEDIVIQMEMQVQQTFETDSLQRKTESRVNSLFTEMNEYKEALKESENANMDLQEKLEAMSTEIGALKLQLTVSEDMLKEIRAEADMTKVHLEQTQIELEAVLQDKKALSHLQEQAQERDAHQQSAAEDKQTESERDKKERSKYEEDLDNMHKLLEASIQQHKTEVQQLVNAHNEERLKLEDSMRQAYDELSILQNSVEEKNSQCFHLEERLQETSTQCATLEDNFKQKSSECSQLTENMNQTLSECVDLKKNLTKISEDLCERDDELHKKAEECATLKADLSQMSADCEKLENDLQQAYAECEKLRNDLKQTSAECEHLQDDLKQRSVDYEKLQHELTQKLSDCEKFQVDLKQMSADCEEMQTELQLKSADCKKIEDDLEQKSAVCEKLQDDLKQISEEFREMDSDYKQKSSDYLRMKEDLEKKLEDCHRLEEDLKEKSLVCNRLKDDLKQKSAECERLEIDVKHKADECVEKENVVKQMSAESIKILESKLADHQEAFNQKCIENDILSTENSRLEEEYQSHLLVCARKCMSLKQNLKEESQKFDIFLSERNNVEDELHSKESAFNISLQEMKKLHRFEFEAVKKELADTKYLLGTKDNVIKDLKYQIEELRSEETALTHNADKETLEMQQALENMQNFTSGLEKELSKSEDEKVVLLSKLSSQAERFKVKEEGMVAENNALNHQLEETRKDAEERVDAMQKQQEKLQSDMEASTVMLKKKEKQLEDLQNEFLEQREEMDSQLAQSIKEKEQIMVQVRSIEDEMDKKLMEAAGQVNFLQAQCDQLSANQSLHLSEWEQEKMDLEEHNKQLHLQLDACASDILQLQQSLEVSATEQDRMKKDRDSLQDHLKAVQLEFSTQLEQAQSQIAEKESEVKNLQAQVVDSENQSRIRLEKLQENLESVQTELGQEKSALISSMEELTAAKSQVDRLTEEKEVLKKNFDCCMEEMTQRATENDGTIKELQGKLLEVCESVDQGQDHLKVMYESQLTELQDQLASAELEVQRLEKAVDNASAEKDKLKEKLGSQIAELELSLQAAESESSTLKEHMSKLAESHEKEKADLKHWSEIQIGSVEDNCQSLEKTLARQEAHMADCNNKFEAEKAEREKAFEQQLSEAYELARMHEMDISRAKRQMDEMRKDHQKEQQSLQNSLDSQMFDLENKYVIASSELERLRQSLWGMEEDHSGETHSLRSKIQELEALSHSKEKKILDLQDKLFHSSQQSDDSMGSLRVSHQSEIDNLEQLNQQLHRDVEDLREKLRTVHKTHSQEVQDLKEKHSQDMVVIQERCLQAEKYSQVLQSHVDSAFQSQSKSDNSELIILRTETEQLQEELIASKASIACLQQQLKEAQMSAQAKISKLEDQVNTLCLDKQALDAYVETLSDGVEKRHLQELQIVPEYCKENSQLLKSEAPQPYPSDETESKFVSSEEDSVVIDHLTQHLEHGGTGVISDGKGNVVHEGFEPEPGSLKYLDLAVDSTTPGDCFVEETDISKAAPRMRLKSVPATRLASAKYEQANRQSGLADQKKAAGGNTQLDNENDSFRDAGRFEPEEEGHMSEGLGSLSEGVSSRPGQLVVEGFQPESLPVTPTDQIPASVPNRGFLPLAVTSLPDGGDENAQRKSSSLLRSSSTQTEGADSVDSGINLSRGKMILPDQTGGEKEDKLQILQDSSAGSASEVEEEALEAAVSRRLKGIQEHLEEEWIQKLRSQEVELRLHYDKELKDFQRDTEHKCQQKIQHVKQETQTSFVDAVRKMRKSLEKKQRKEQKQTAQEKVKGRGAKAAIPEGREDQDDEDGEKGEDIIKQLLKENQELAEVRDVLLEQIAISQTQGRRHTMQHELQAFITGGSKLSLAQALKSASGSELDTQGSPDASGSVSSEPAIERQENRSLTASPKENLWDSAGKEVTAEDEKAMALRDVHKDSGDLPEESTPTTRSDDEEEDGSEGSCVRDRFLEELEEMSQQSGQDLPLEWELTTTTGVSHTSSSAAGGSGSFHHDQLDSGSVWEVFDGRCLRQDCREVRLRYNNLFHWLSRACSLPTSAALQGGGAEGATAVGGVDLGLEEGGRLGVKEQGDGWIEDDVEDVSLAFADNFLENREVLLRALLRSVGDTNPEAAQEQGEVSGLSEADLFERLLALESQKVSSTQNLKTQMQMFGQMQQEAEDRCEDLENATCIPVKDLDYIIIDCDDEDGDVCQEQRKEADEGLSSEDKGGEEKLAVQDALQERVNALQLQVDSFQKGNDNLTQELQAANEMVQAFQKRLDSFQNDNDVLTEQLKTANDTAQTFQKKVDTLQEGHTELSQRLKTGCEREQAFQEKLKLCEKENSDLSQQLKMANETAQAFQDKLDALQLQQKETANNTEQAFQGKVDVLLKDNAELSQQLQAANEMVQAFQEKVDSFQKDSVELTEQLKIANETVQAFQEKVDALQLRVESFHKDNDILTDQLQRASKTALMLQEEHSKLQEKEALLEEESASLREDVKHLKTRNEDLKDKLKEESTLHQESVQDLASSALIKEQEKESIHQELQHQRDALQSKCSSLEKQLTDFQNSVSQIQSDNQSLLLESQMCETKYVELEYELEKTENQCRCLEESNRSLLEKNNILQSQIQDHIDTLNSTHDSHSMEIMKASDDLQEATKVLKSFQEQNNVLHVRNESLLNKNDSLNEENNSLRVELKSVRDKCAVLEDEAHSQLTKNEGLEIQMQFLQDNLQAADRMNTSLVNKVKALESSKGLVTEFEETNRSLEEKYAKLVEENNTLQVDYRLLEEKCKSLQEELIEASQLKKSLKEQKLKMKRLRNETIGGNLHAHKEPHGFKSGSGMQTESKQTSEEQTGAAKAGQRKENEDLRHQVSHLEYVLKEKDDLITELKGQINDLSLQSPVDTLQVSAIAADKEIDDLQVQNVSLSERILILEDSNQSLLDQCKTGQDRISLLEEENNGHVDKQEELEVLLKFTRENLQAADSMNSSLLKKLQSQEAAKKISRDLSASNASIQETCTTLTKENGTLKRDLKSLEEKCRTLQSELQEALRSGQSLREQLGAQSVKMEQMVSEMKAESSQGKEGSCHTDSSGENEDRLRQLEEMVSDKENLIAELKEQMTAMSLQQAAVGAPYAHRESTPDLEQEVRNLREELIEKESLIHELKVQDTQASRERSWREDSDFEQEIGLLQQALFEKEKLIQELRESKLLLLDESSRSLSMRVAGAGSREQTPASGTQEEVQPEDQGGARAQVRTSKLFPSSERSVESTESLAISSDPDSDIIPGVDMDIVKEMGRLRKDIKKTKAFYANESALFQEVLDREPVSQLGLKNSSVVDFSEMTDNDIPDDQEELKRMVVRLLEENKSLTTENLRLQLRIREQEALVVEMEDKLQTAPAERPEKFQSLFERQLLLLQKQRDELLQQICQRDSGLRLLSSRLGKEAVDAATSQQQQEDLTAKVGELEHCHQLLQQRHSELAHCQAEKRHLEQLLLLKDETERQLMRQKRLLEEELSTIEGKLQEREATLVEERARLMQELKEKELHIYHLQANQSSSLGPLPQLSPREPDHRPPSAAMMGYPQNTSTPLPSSRAQSAQAFFMQNPVPRVQDLSLPLQPQQEQERGAQGGSSGDDRLQASSSHSSQQRGHSLKSQSFPHVDKAGLLAHSAGDPLAGRRHSTGMSSAAGYSHVSYPTDLEDMYKLHRDAVEKLKDRLQIQMEAEVARISDSPSDAITKYWQRRKPQP